MSVYILLYGGALPGGVGAPVRCTCILLYATQVKKKKKTTKYICHAKQDHPV